MAKILTVFFLCFVIWQLSDAARIRRQETEFVFPDEFSGTNTPTKPAGNRPGRPDGGNRPNPGRPDGGNRPNPGRPDGGNRPGGNQTTRRPSTTTQATTNVQTSTVNPECQRRCLRTPEYNPVCGTDNERYENMSLLECAKRCGKPELALLRVGSCPPPPDSLA